MDNRGPLVAVVGQGYVGLPLSILASKRGYQVVGLDSNLVKVKNISSGLVDISGVRADLILSAIRSNRYRATSDYLEIENFSFAIITVPTPLDNGNPDLTFVKKAGRSVGRHLSPGAAVILESTTYPGTTQEVLVPILESESGLLAGRDFFVGYSPERIDPGNRRWSLTNTPKIVAGFDQDSLEAVDGFYRSLGIPCIRASGMREAELTKLLENTFRHVNIALVNEMSLFAESLGVDLYEAIELADSKPFGYMKFTPGPGVGGHCLPIDPSYLSWAIRDKTGMDFEFVELANRVNQSMPAMVVRRLQEKLGIDRESLAGMEILLIGLTYKKNVSDVREAPSLEIARILREAGARVYGLDNHVLDEDWPTGISRVDHPLQRDFAAGILVTAHDDLDVFSLQQRCPAILDTQNVLRERQS